MNTIEDLHTADRQGLVTLWTKTFKSTPPPKMSRDLMRRYIAFEMQAKRRGGIAPKLRKALERMTAQKAAGASASPVLSSAPPPGTRLVREWNGTVHHVEVTDTGCIWQGRTYRSLSAIAREITGARWSGPRFFGLRPGRGA
ncbi:DUF2924 domain-containing protein [Roseisalinus antarcticus]|uniref:DUF2924 domain-containing protein n=1 Tax=Roseisalinus antarcticus TaxID=254357 RepID=A0A1Y5TYE9_9RHOB|nr:DUF2924 domain-containing protein [Roseisalinus antarcticus]SLN76480.1 hypothetical protein ROA7023_04187 [Roseisalinus antarcticus]